MDIEMLIRRNEMNEQKDRRLREREEIAARLASFKATQEKFKKEREKYCVTTLENARHSVERRPASA